MPSERDLDTLAWTMLGEAGGEGQGGMADVGHVILNRLETGRYGASIADVARANKQFSTWNAGEGGNNPQGRYPKNSAEFKKAREIAEQVVAGAIPGPPGKPLDYNAPEITPYWAESKSQHGTYTRNGHVFYPSVPIPPGDIPQVATALSTTRSPVTGSPTPMPPMLAAQRNLQPTTQDTASLYAGIYPETAPPPSGMLRPFDAERNTPRPNADGSISTELTRTVQFSDGSWGNVPSLWWGEGSKNQNLDRMDDDQLAAFASRYEQQSGQNFPRFQNLQQAERAAEYRSNAGAGTTSHITRPTLPPVGTPDTASLYRGIYPQAPAPAPRPASQPSMVFGSGINDSFAAANAASSPDLAASLASYLAPKAPASAMRQPSASERSALAYVAPPTPRTPPAANGRDLQRAEQTQRLQPRVTTVASIPTTPARVQLPPIPPATPKAPTPAMRQPSASERAALAYVPPPAPVNPRIGQPPATRTVASVPVRPSMPGPTNDLGAPLPSFSDFQTAFGRPAIPGPSAPPKIGEERLVAGEWGVPGIKGLPTLPGQDFGVGTALSVMPPMPRPRPMQMQPQMASVPLPRPRPAPVQQAPVSRGIFGMPTSSALRPTGRPPLNVTVQGARTQRPSGGSSSSSSSSAPRYQHKGVEVYATPTKHYNASTNQFETVTTYKPR